MDPLGQRTSDAAPSLSLTRAAASPSLSALIVPGLLTKSAKHGYRNAERTIVPRPVPRLSFLDTDRKEVGRCSPPGTNAGAPPARS
jgi:hypothetical protein